MAQQIPTLGFGPGGSIAQVVLLGFSPSTTPAAADLYAAIFALLEADATLVSAFGRSGFCYAGDAGRGDPLPRSCLSDLGGQDDYESPLDDDTASGLTEVTFQIATHAASRAAARSLGRKLALRLEQADDAGELLFQEGTLFYLRREGPAIDTLDEEKGPSGLDVRTHVVQFRALVEFTR